MIKIKKTQSLTERKYKAFDVVYIKKLDPSKKYFRQERVGIIERVKKDDDANVYEEKVLTGTSFFIRFENADLSGWYKSEDVIFLCEADNNLKQMLKDLIDKHKVYSDIWDKVDDEFTKLRNNNLKKTKYNRRGYPERN